MAHAASESRTWMEPARGPDGLPRLFGKYTLLRKLAVDGMAEIYLALHRSVAGFEKLLVLKRVLPHLSADETFISLLLSEARIAATLSHPNIIHVYDVGEVEGQYFIAMEHIHGEDLRSIIRQMKRVGIDSFPLEHAMALAVGCCAGLAFAHEQRDLSGKPMNIVHRDVSPQNLVVSFSGDVKLVDFGIAKAGRSHFEHTGSDQIRGKVPYMSPEQARGQALDGRSDVFSLGIMLFELCTGRRLFRGANEFETLHMITEGSYPRARDVHPEIHPRLDAILARALERDVDKRYPSARQMQADLEEFVRAEKIAVSALSLSRWMSELFEEKLHEQQQLLARGLELADVIAAQAALEQDHRQSQEASQSFIRLKERKRPTKTIVALGALTLATGSALALAWLSSDTAAPVTDSRERQDRTAPESGIAHVSTAPSGAEIVFDDQPLPGRTPLSIPAVSPGVTHRLIARLPGYENISRTLSIEPGMEVDVSVDLRPLPTDLATSR